MKRVKLIVAYDGTAYCGWQVQDNGETIEGVLNRELSRLLKEDIHVIGASRTDSGVHSLGNVCVFDTETRIPAEKIVYAINQRLPLDIRVIESTEVSPEFHPRHCRSVKTYEYRIWNDKFMNPTMRLYTKFCYYPIDVEKMRRAAVYLLGEHDFKSFCSVNTAVKSTVRTIYKIDIEKEGCLITIRIKGNGFLYNMVRIIAGSLLNVGMNLKKEESIKEMLEACDRQAAGPTAEACGLTMIGLQYIDGDDKAINSAQINHKNDIDTPDNVV